MLALYLDGRDYRYSEPLYHHLRSMHTDFFMEFVRVIDVSTIPVNQRPRLQTIPCLQFKHYYYYGEDILRFYEFQLQEFARRQYQQQQKQAAAVAKYPQTKFPTGTSAVAPIGARDERLSEEDRIAQRRQSSLRPSTSQTVSQPSLMSHNNVSDMELSSREMSKLLQSQGTISLHASDGGGMASLDMGGLGTELSSEDRIAFASDPIPDDDVDINAYVKQKMAQRQT